jgi:uncharacterized protein (DUF1800 family)
MNQDSTQLTAGPRLQRWAQAALLALAVIGIAACGSGGSSPPPPGANALSATRPAAPDVSGKPSFEDAARFVAQATFGARSLDDIEYVRNNGYEAWLWDQFRAPAASHMAYINSQRARERSRDFPLGRYTEEMSYEAMWQQWLYGDDQLRARVAFALTQILVISNVSPELRAESMSSYMDMINKNAFGNFRQLLEEVTLHPAMGYYLNMIQSEKENAGKGTYPNENYAREILQLFSIGLVKLNIDGSMQLDANGLPQPAYDENVVKGFARAFTGWSFGNAGTNFYMGENEGDWTQPMKGFSSKHEPGDKQLLDGYVLKGSTSPEASMKTALDQIFAHPNVGPFISRQLIQRLVTSNPSPAYIRRVATVFNDNGSGVRGDLKAVVRAILVDAEARDVSVTASDTFGKQREPVIRFANFLRATGAKSKSGINQIHYLDSSDNGLGQSPLLSPTVFNYFSPSYAAPGPIADRGLTSPEFQITTETSVVGSLNFFANLFNSGGYGGGDHRLVMDYSGLRNLAGDANALAEHLNKLFYLGAMTPETRSTLTTAVNGIDANNRDARVKAALILTAIAPDFVIQK